ncbi:hypothetical protein CPHO_01735 [Corynebacterium phocae]|uniref:Uncharacterized protein n=1 Tax=Corynebacterium phocae TaxID=161895 RepID=A0A1L7D158_9CORY|nr:hypothetical protein [Corynebacterium phocae]APT91838.1 hypothetical protein CPHO_01735 [Corynebacterium phocae]KAA8727448.1 hypothetical protein F4V58_01295 [Corynebacterium phocae]
MGRLILILLVIAAVYLVWKAFGPASWKKPDALGEPPRQIKGPDDDEDFLWELEKKRFKERRRREQENHEE